VGCIYIGHNSGQWWAVLNKVMYLQSFVKVGKFLDHTSDCQLVAIILPHDDNAF